MEYYFQDQLRWSFGFDNPNKAAALIASLLPLIWIITSSVSRLKKPFLKWTCVLLGALILCAGWWFLFKTYSRGGMVASVAAFAYIGFCRRRTLKPYWLLIVACSVAIAGLFISTQAAERSVGWIGKHEGSVENRFVLWKGGLEMLAANPQGVGQGNSGELYMQWVQPLDMTARYRTLVNSYLTFVVEQGIWIFGAALFLAAAIWNIGGGGQGAGFSRDAVIGLQAALLAFAVAGLFSTTMEELNLWAVPFCCAGALLILRLLTRKGAGLTAELTRAAVMSVAICGILYTAGWLLGRNERLRIVLHRHGQELTVLVEPLNRNVKRDPRRLRVIVDKEVMGEDYGKLVRRLAIETGMRVTVSDSAESIQAGEAVLAAGEGVNQLPDSNDKDLLLLTPARIDEQAAQKILYFSKSVKVLLPAFDEDGRVAFWNDAIEKAGRPTVINPTVLEGVGTDVEWAWDTVIRQCGDTR